jgi:hypothetical protein
LLRLLLLPHTTHTPYPTNSAGITLDNIVVGHDVDAALAFAERTWRPRAAAEAEQQKAEPAAEDDDTGADSTGIKALASKYATRAQSVALDLKDQVVDYITQGGTKSAQGPLAAVGTLLALSLGLLLLLRPSKEKRSVAEEDDVDDDEGVEETKSSEPPQQAAAVVAVQQPVAAPVVTAAPAVAAVVDLTEEPAADTDED